jgi:hypothetical protein
LVSTPLSVRLLIAKSPFSRPSANAVLSSRLASVTAIDAQPVTMVATRNPAVIFDVRNI